MQNEVPPIIFYSLCSLLTTTKELYQEGLLACCIEEQGLKKYLLSKVLPTRSHFLFDSYPQNNSQKLIYQKCHIFDTSLTSIIS